MFEISHSALKELEWRAYLRRCSCFHLLAQAAGTANAADSCVLNGAEMLLIGLETLQPQTEL